MPALARSFMKFMYRPDSPGITLIRSLLWRLDQFQTIPGGINSKTYYHAGVPERARVAVHSPTGRFYSRHGGRYIGHIEYYMWYRVLETVGWARHDDDLGARIGLVSIHRLTEV